jgi:hypothetical protein
MAAMWNWLMAVRCSRFRIEQQAFRQAPFFFRKRREALQLLGVYDSQIQPSLGAVIKEDRVHHFARGGRQAE